MRLRRVLLPGLAAMITAGALAAPSATAALPRACNTLSDVKGDGHSANFLVGDRIASKALDILSADIATGRNELVAVLRLDSTATDTDTWATAIGFSWTFTVTLGGADYYFWMKRPFNHGKQDTEVKVGGAVIEGYTFAVEGNSLVWRVPRSKLPGLNKKKGQYFERFRATSNVNGTADTAVDGKKRYTDLQPSCVKAR